jgi:hypothetical protein
MKKKTIITTETREIWVIRQPFGIVEEPTPHVRESEPTSESLTLHVEHEAKKDDDSSAQSTTPEVQE